MNFTNTKEKAKKEYLKKAPLTEKKVSSMISVKLTEDEAEIINNFIESLQTIGIRSTKSNFIRQAIFEYIQRHTKDAEEVSGEWDDEPMTLNEASKIYDVPVSTIRTAINRKRFGPHEHKKMENGEWVVTKAGMNRIFKNKRPFNN
jgi:Arc/MetJ-type ribon-helix-helix transcriptional regulator